MRARLLLAGAAALFVAGMALAQEEAPAMPAPVPPPLTLSARLEASGGEALYLQHCAMCHGPGGMGTALLARRRDVALLEQRGDLLAPYVMVAARNGVGNMPPVPRGEVSDAELLAIAAWLAAGPHLPPGQEMVGDVAP